MKKPAVTAVTAVTSL